MVCENIPSLKVSNFDIVRDLLTKSLSFPEGGFELEEKQKIRSFIYFNVSISQIFYISNYILIT